MTVGVKLERSDQAVSRGTMPAAASWACLAVFSAGWSTDASKTSAALDTIAGPRATTRPVLSAAVASTASIRTAIAVSAPSSPTTCGGRREPVLAGSGDLAEHGTERVVRAGLERHGLAAVAAR